MDRELSGPEKLYLNASKVLNGPFKIILSITTVLSDILMVIFGMGMNAIMSPGLMFLYPFVGIQLALGDKDGKIRARLDPDFEPEGLYEQIFAFSHYLIFEAETILKLAGIEPRNVHPSDMSAFTLAMAYGMQWSLLLPNCIVMIGGGAYLIYPEGFWRLLHMASDWMAEHSRKKDDDLPVPE